MRIVWGRLVLAIKWLRIAFHIALGVTLVAACFGWVARERRHAMVRWWSRRILRICGVQVRVVGPEGVTVYRSDGRSPANARTIEAALRPGGVGAMLVLNHISWTDIYVVHSVRAARFVAKSEIARWPVIGYLTSRTGTVFIERGRRHAVREVNHRVAELLRGGDLIAVFPEGTTGDGDRLLPFHANLLQPAIDAGAPVVVGGIRYLDVRGRPTAAASYAGDVSLLESLNRILRAGPIVAELHLIDALDGAGLTRHVLGQRARELIAQRLGFDDEVDEAADEIARVLVTADADVRGASGTARREPETAIDPRDELL